MTTSNTILPTLSLFSPAKINLFLHITGKRHDGYHNLQTVFRLLEWGDRLDFYVSEDSVDPAEVLKQTELPITLACNTLITDSIADNLVTKAAMALLTHKADSDSLPTLPNRLPVVHIHLDKVLPTGAGLGGGSSNAATTLLALNQLWGFDLDTQTLIGIGARVGADVPIFILKKDAIAEGIGEQLTPIDLPQHHYLLLNPKAHVATKALFGHPNLVRDTPKLSINAINDLKKDYANQLRAPFSNVFEPIVEQLQPKVADALTYLRQLEKITGSTARMTGTGSSVFLPIPVEHLQAVEHYITQVTPPPCHALITESLLSENNI